MQSPRRFLSDTAEPLEWINKSEVVPRPPATKAPHGLSQNKTLAFSVEAFNARLQPFVVFINVTPA